jgi:hypothetical protein
MLPGQVINLLADAVTLCDRKGADAEGQLRVTARVFKRRLCDQTRLDLIPRRLSALIATLGYRPED